MGDIWVRRFSKFYEWYDTDTTFAPFNQKR